MPTGLPDPSKISDSVRSAIDAVSNQTRYAADYLRIPSYTEYSASVREAYIDLLRASKSSLRVFDLTFRPLFILLGLLSRYVAIFLKILAECTIKHGIVAAREGAGQAQIAAKWFVAWQRSLSRGAILAELGAIAAAVGLYLLRRHIRRKRYVERVRSWCARKKARALRRYNNFVARVSRTSTFLAMLLPHALYITVVSVCKYFAPWLLCYFATKTYSTALISLWIPFVRTVLLLHRWKGAVQNEKKKTGVSSGNSVSSSSSHKSRESSKGPVPKDGVGLRKKTSKVAERYLQATEQSSTRSESSSGAERRKIMPKGNVPDEESVDDLYEESMDLLKYWVVYALIYSIGRTASLLPIIGRIISVEDPSKTVASSTGRWPGQNGTKTFWSSLKLSYQFSEEVKLAFFLWLRYLPTSLTATSHERRSVHKKAAAWDKRATSQHAISPNRPLDIIYQRLAPIAVAAADSSSNLSQATDSDTGFKGLLHQGMKFVRSFLQVAVFMKIISDPTKKWIETTLVECSALLPAAVTLLMPGYFTEFGCIYVANVVPSANSATAFSAVEMKLAADDRILAGEDLALGMRYLKYWVIHCLLSAILSSFAPLLAWVPLSTHITWLLWAFVQLESSTNRIFAVFEWELKAFGLLHRHEGDSEDMEFGTTVTARLIRKMSTAVPVAAASSDEGTEKENGASAEARVMEATENAHSPGYSGAAEEEVDASETLGDAKENNSTVHALGAGNEGSQKPCLEGAASSGGENVSVGMRRRASPQKSHGADVGAKNASVHLENSPIQAPQELNGAVNKDGCSDDNKSKIE